ncbi:MAG: efflux RND transporter periplasmic adaptor subunit [Pseudomonadota bacterium]
MRRAAIRIALAAGAVFAATQAIAQEVSGVLEPVRSVELRPVIDAAIAEVLVEEGDLVKAGAPLVRFDESVQRARVAAAAATPADARIARAGVSVESAQSTFERVDRAASRGGAPKWEVAQAQFLLREAQADLRLAEDLKTADEARRALEEALLGQFAVAAPFDGLVTEVTATVGETAARSEPLLVLEDFSTLEAVVFAPVADRASLRQGGRYVARLGPPLDLEVEATLRFVEPRIDPASQTVKAIFVIDNAGQNAPAGVDLLVDLSAPAQ